MDDCLLAPDELSWNFFELFHRVLVSRGWRFANNRIVRADGGVEGVDWFADSAAAEAFLRASNNNNNNNIACPNAALGLLDAPLRRPSRGDLSPQRIPDELRPATFDEVPPLVAKCSPPALPTPQQVVDRRQPVVVPPLVARSSPPALPPVLAPPPPPETQEKVVPAPSSTTLAETDRDRGERTERASTARDDVSSPLEVSPSDPVPLLSALAGQSMLSRLQQLGWRIETSLRGPTRYFRPGARELPAPRLGHHYFASELDVAAFIERNEIDGQSRIGHVDEEEPLWCRDWTILLETLKTLGWSYKPGSGLDYYLYFRPGAKPARQGGQLGREFFATPDDVRTFARDWRLDGERRTGHVDEDAPPPPTPPYRRTQVEEDDDDDDQEEEERPWELPSHELWEFLRSRCGWVYKNGFGLDSWLYFRPGAPSIKAGARRGTHYFGISELPTFAKYWKIDGETRMGHVDEAELADSPIGRLAKLTSDLPRRTRRARVPNRMLQGEFVLANDKPADSRPLWHRGFGPQWAALLGSGWRCVEGANGSRLYLRPGVGSVGAAVKGTDYFESPTAVQRFVKKHRLDGVDRIGHVDDEYLRDDDVDNDDASLQSTRGATTFPLSSSEPAPAPTTSPPKRTKTTTITTTTTTMALHTPGELWELPWSQVWKALQGCGWTWRRGKNELQDFLYYRPGANCMVGGMEDVHYFANPERVLQWLEENSIDADSRTGSIHEEYRAPVPTQDKSSTVGRLQPRLRATTARGSTTEPAPAPATTTRAPKRNKRRKPVETPGNEALWELPWSQVWKALQGCGWTWRRGKNELQDFLYYRPGANCMVGGMEDVHYFANPERVLQWLEENRIDADSRTGSIHEEYRAPVPTQDKSSTVGRLQPRLRATTARGSTTEPAPALATTTRAPKRNKRRKPVETPVNEELWELPWSQVWKMLQACGWTWHRGKNELQDYLYYRPGASCMVGAMEDVHYFANPERVLQWLEENSIDADSRTGSIHEEYHTHTTSQDDPSSTVGRLEPRLRATAARGSTTEPAPAQVTTTRAPKRNKRSKPVYTPGTEELWELPWSHVWKMLQACGWTWHRGKNELQDYLYYRPGASCMVGAMEDVHYFANPERVLQWLEENSIDADSCTGSIHEEYHTHTTSQDDPSSTVGRLEPRLRATAARGSTTEPAPAQVTTTRAPKRNKRRKPVETPVNEELWELPWSQVWKMLQACGWTWHRGKNELQDYLYYRPGASCMVGAMEDVHYFANPERVLQWLEENSIDADSRTGSIHEEYHTHTTSQDDPSSTVGRLEPRLRATAARGSTTAQVTTTRAPKRNKRSKPVYTPGTEEVWELPWTHVWKMLQACGWTWHRGKNELQDFLYYRPGASCMVGAMEDVHYFANPERVLQWLEENRIDADSRTGSIHEEYHTQHSTSQDDPSSTVGRLQPRLRATTARGSTTAEPAPAQVMTTRAPKRNKRSMPVYTPGTEELWELPWSQVWKALQGCGWTWRRGKNELQDYLYYRPGASCMVGAMEDVHYFANPERVLQWLEEHRIDADSRTGSIHEEYHTQHSTSQDDPSFTVGRLEPRLRATAARGSTTAEPAPAQVTTTRAPKRNKRSKPVYTPGTEEVWELPWTHVWKMLQACGWTWHRGKNELQDFLYYRPGASCMVGAMEDVHYFANPERVLQWLEENRIDADSRTGSIHEEYHTQHSTSQDDPSSTVGRLQPRLRATTARGSTTAEPAPAQVMTTRAPKRNKRSMPVYTPGTEELWELPWSQVWKALQGCGWTWRRGKNELQDYLYYRPGASCMVGAMEDVHYFANPERVLQWLEEHRIDADSRTGSIREEYHTQHSTSQDDPSSTVGRLEPRLRATTARCSTTAEPAPAPAQVTTTRAPKRAKRSKPVHTPGTEELWELPWSQAWKTLQSCGWTWRKGKNELQDYLYYRPGASCMVGGMEDVHYFVNPERVLQWLEEHRIDAKSRTGSIHEEWINVVDPTTTVRIVDTSVQEDEEVARLEEEEEEDDDDDDDSSSEAVRDDYCESEEGGPVVAVVSSFESEEEDDEPSAARSAADAPTRDEDSLFSVVVDAESRAQVPDSTCDESVASSVSMPEDMFDAWLSGLGLPELQRNSGLNSREDSSEPTTTERSFDRRFEGFGSLYRILQEMGWTHKSSSDLEARGGLVYVAPDSRVFLCANDVVDHVRKDPEVVMRMGGEEEEVEAAVLPSALGDWLVSRAVDDDGPGESSAEGDRAFGDVCPRASAYFLAAASAAGSGSGSGSGGRRDKASLNEALEAPTAAEVEAYVAARDPPPLEPEFAEHLEARFPWWGAILLAGSNLLLQGFGSKRRVLEKFAASHLAKSGTVVVIDGFKRDLDLRAELVAAAKELRLPIDDVRGMALGAVARRLAAAAKSRVHVVVHSIDGPRLRSESAQRALAALVSSPRVHLACSVDTVNAPLMWDARLANAFNLVIADATTFAWYDDEAPAAALLASGPAPTTLDATTEEGLSYVLTSLTSRHLELLHLIAAAHKNNNSLGKGGITFREIFEKARRRMIAHTEDQTRAFLQEFLDHNLIRLKHHRGADLYRVPDAYVGPILARATSTSLLLLS